MRELIQKLNNERDFDTTMFGGLVVLLCFMIGLVVFTVIVGLVLAGWWGLLIGTIISLLTTTAWLIGPWAADKLDF